MKKIKNPISEFAQKTKAAIDWNYVSREKAEMIYSDALKFHKEIMDSLNVMNSKAFQILTVAMPILTVVLGFLITQPENVSRKILVTAIVFSLSLMLSIIFLFMAVWPRDIRISGIEPLSYFATDYYKKKIEDIIYGNILLAFDTIEINHKARIKRARWLRAGLICFFYSPIAAGIAFLSILLIF